MATTPAQSKPEGSTNGSSSPTPDPKAIAVALGHSILLPLTDVEESYLDFSALSKYKITSVRPLDFHTGMAVGKKHLQSPPSEQYIQPMSEDEIWKWLHMYKPWKYRADISVEAKQHTGYHEARFFWILMSCYLNGCQDETKMGFMKVHTPWQARPIGSSSKLVARRCQGQHDWSLVSIFQQAKHAPGPLCLDRPLDPEKPHVVAFLADSAPLRQDMISTSELTVSLYLACTALMFEVHNGHRYFPVTLITGADRTLRITQCILDIVSQTFELRQTPLLQFENGVWEERKNGKALQTDFITLLRWVVGNPVGRTTLS